MKSRAIVFCGDCWHPAGLIRQELANFCADEFEFEFPQNDRLPSAQLLKDFDLAVIARANIISENQPWLKSDAEHDLAGFVKRGGGLLAIHAGVSRYDHLPKLHHLLGGAFIGHPEICAVTLEPLGKNPVAADMESFSAPDEHYFVRLDEHSEIFLRSRSSNGIQPAGWMLNIGDGRVCVLTPGHTPEMWRHPEFQKLVRNALHWTTTAG
ncbi:MAG TPA: ThuA domain-containing protein [Verrucomicrobiae bacterium]|nr:ThuA domain-containing protein [Verrucomicrobiae bacterium]